MYQLHSYQQNMRVIVVPHLYQHFVLSVFLIIVILLGTHWYLVVILNCISLMTMLVIFSFAHQSFIYPVQCGVCLSLLPVFLGCHFIIDL